MKNNNITVLLPFVFIVAWIICGKVVWYDYNKIVFWVWSIIGLLPLVLLLIQQYVVLSKAIRAQKKRG